jgi:5-methylcytosine-specific restriction endonuclease McrA
MILPHCRTCSCTAPPPSTFRSDVLSLPVDLHGVARTERRDGTIAEYQYPGYTDWQPRYERFRNRIACYETLLDLDPELNIREAVKLLAAGRRRWLAEETARHTARLRRKHTNRLPGYSRGLAVKRELILAEGHPWAYCGDPKPRSIDHVMPVARGGDHRRKNLVPACMRCNGQKNNRTPEEWRADRLAAGQPWPPVHRPSRRAS